MINYSCWDLIDVKQIRSIMESFYELTGIAVTMVDLEGNLLTDENGKNLIVGEQEICSTFHRVHPETMEKCVESDTTPRSMKSGEKYSYYQCFNGLTDVVVPVYVEGEHLINLFAGQFFFKPPNIEFFQKQAQKYGFNEEEYLSTLFKVPVFTLEYVKKGLHFLSEIAEMIGTMGLKEKRIMEANRALKGSLKEKEVLLREVHHRVNNNIQIVSSILSLQENYVEEEETLNVLKENRNRIKAIAMVHANLYESPNMSYINMGSYIKKLVMSLFYSHGTEPSTVKPVFHLDDARLSMETAIPLGLIIKELVSNSLKFAFPQKNGTITVEFRSENDGYLLKLADDGAGLPEWIDPQNTGTLGLQLVKSLVKQLNGTIEFDRSNGTRFTLHFQELNYMERF